MKLFVEQLENRDLLAATVNLSAAGVLNILADNAGDYIVVQNATVNGAAVVQVLEPTGPVGNGTNLVWNFPAATVTGLSFLGGNGAFGDTVFNNANLNAVFIAGFNSGQNLFVGGTNSDTFIGSANPAAENDFQDGSGAPNTFIGGPGFTNINGGAANDTVVLGTGRHLVYEILGTNLIVSNGSGTLLVNAASTVLPAAGDTVVTFFQPVFATTASPFVFQKDANGNNILYVLPQSTTSQVQVFLNYTDATLQNIRANYTDGTTVQSTVFPAASVSWFAYFGGLRGGPAPSVASTYIFNGTQTNAVFYGGRGNDYIVSYGLVNVLKGHAGNDIVAGFGKYNDLQAGPSTTGSILLVSQAGETIVRPNRAAVADQIGNALQPGDLIVGPVRAINGPALGDGDTVLDATDYLYLYFAEVQSRKQGPFGF